MHEHELYGLWILVILNSAIFILFAFIFTKPKTQQDWLSLGVFSTFIVAIFTERYGFPLTIYFLAGWLAEKYPGVDFMAHENGHLLHVFFGFEGDSLFDTLRIVGGILILLGFFVLASTWTVLHKAQQTCALAISGWYARMRHPQYVAFILIMFGFLLQGPTIPTLIMFPISLVVYLRLSNAEGRQTLEQFGDQYIHYVMNTPAFIPKIWPVAAKQHQQIKR